MTAWPPNVFAGYAHIPLVRFEGVPRIETPEGHLATLSYRVWQALDGGNYSGARDYDRTSPVFLCVQNHAEGLREDPSDDEVLEQFELMRDVLGHLRYEVHLSLLLATQQLIPEPALSAAYVQRWATGQHLRWFGPFEREAILFGHREPRTCVLTPEAVSSFLTVYAMLRAENSPLSERPCERALQVLRVTALPECSIENGFVQTVASLESLLSPERKNGLKDTFGRRAAALLGNPRRPWSEDYEFFRAIYAVRSELIHGGDPLPRIAEIGMKPLSCYRLGRSLLCDSLLRYSQWRQSGGADGWSGFQAALDGAAGDASAWAGLHRSWTEASGHAH